MNKTIRQIAHELENSRVSLETGDLAGRILKEIPPALYEHYLREALRMIAPTLKADLRRQAFKAVTATSRGVGAPQRVQIPAERTITVVDHEGNEARMPNPEYTKSVSAKRDIIKSEWENYLAQNIPTGDESRPYILIKDATVADLQYAANSRRALGAKLEAEAAKYDALANQMQIKGASTLGTLTADDVQGIL